jgi:hypothetical protein
MRLYKVKKKSLESKSKKGTKAQTTFAKASVVEGRNGTKEEMGELV